MGSGATCIFVGYMDVFQSFWDPLAQLFRWYIDKCIGDASCTNTDFQILIPVAANFSLLSSSHDPSRWQGIGEPKSIASRQNSSSSYLASSNDSIPFSHFLCLCCICSVEEMFCTGFLFLNQGFRLPEGKNPQLHLIYFPHFCSHHLLLDRARTEIPWSSPSTQLFSTFNGSSFTMFVRFCQQKNTFLSF